MLLCVDIGNTEITLAALEGENAGHLWRLSNSAEKSADEYAMSLETLLTRKGIVPGKLEGVSLASVVPRRTEPFRQACAELTGKEPLIVDAGVKTGLKIRFENPREIGADRVADAVATKKLYSLPAIIVDFGTATAFDALSSEGEYLGGAIAPGIGISAEAMFERTAKLKSVEIERPQSSIGRTTQAGIRSGLFFGFASLAEGMIRRMKAELGGRASVIVTGAWAQALAKEIGGVDAVDPLLTMKGLRYIFDMNKP